MARRNLFDTGSTVPLVTGLARALGTGAAHQAQTLIGRGKRLDLDGRVVFITGAARGLGADIARHAHARGALVGRRLAPLEKLAADLGERAAAFEADVSDFDALQRAATGTAEHFGGIDVVVANAGIEPMTRALRVELACHGATAGVAYLGFVKTDLARDVFAQAHIEDTRAALPGWVTRPIASPRAAEALVKGIEHRAAQVGVPGWVLPALRMRGVHSALDEVFIHNPGVAAAVRRAETEHAEKKR